MVGARPYRRLELIMSSFGSHAARGLVAIALVTAASGSACAQHYAQSASQPPTNPIEAFFKGLFGGGQSPAEPRKGIYERSDRNSNRETHSSARQVSYRHDSGRHSHPGGEGGGGGGSYLVCVRKCDGSFFPVSTSGVSRWDMAEEVCRLMCPNAEVVVYSFPEGGTIEEGASLAGQAYRELPNAGKFEQSFATDCSCRRPNQSWADVLAAAEARYGHGSHDIVVTLEASERMSRPVVDPKAKVVANLATASDVSPSAPAQPEPGVLDVNGVDTGLKAATASLSHEASGIRDEETKSGAHFGLNQGRVIQDADADGSPQRVRVLTPSF